MSLVVESGDGTVTVTEAVLNQIVVTAAESVEGARVRGRRRHVEIEIDDDRARVQLELRVAFGRVLPETARAVQERVADALGTMCGVTASIDVAIEELG